MSPSYLAPLIDAFSFLFLTTTYHSFPSVSTVKDKSNPSTRIWRLRHQDLSFFLLCHVLLGVQLVLHNSHYELCSTGEQLWCYSTWQWMPNRWYWLGMGSSACFLQWRVIFDPPMLPFTDSQCSSLTPLLMDSLTRSFLLFLSLPFLLLSCPFSFSTILAFIHSLSLTLILLPHHFSHTSLTTSHTLVSPLFRCFQWAAGRGAVQHWVAIITSLTSL